MSKLLRAAIVAAAIAIIAALAATADAKKAPPETYVALQKQIAAKQVSTATVSPSKHTAKVKLKNGTKYDVTFPAANQAQLIASLKSSGAKIHVDKKKKTSSRFRLRYIVLIAVIVIAVIAGVAWFVQRRRAGPRPPATTAPGGAAPE